MRIIGQEQIAEVFGVAPKTIVEWQEQGFPIAIRGQRGVASEYETEPCIAWLVAREVGKVQGDESPRDRVYRLQGDALERDALEKAGLLVHVDQIEPKWRAAVLSAREFLMREPAPLASRLQGLQRRQVEEVLRSSFDEFLRRLAAWRHADEDDDPADTAPVAESAEAGLQP